MSEPISEALAARSVGRIFARRRFAGACLAVAALAAAGLLAMADRSVAQTDVCAASTSTTCSVAVGGSTTGNIEVALDRDWFSVELVAGTEYQIELRGANTGDGSLRDPELYGIKDATGNDVKSGDSDSGVLFNSELIFTPTASGTYYIVAGSLDEFTDARGVVELFYLGRARKGAAVGESPPVSRTYSATGTYTLEVKTPPDPAYPDPGFQCRRWLIEVWPGFGICLLHTHDTARRYLAGFAAIASVADASADEGEKVQFVVTIDMDVTDVVVVEYATSIESGDTADEAADFTPVINGTVEIPVGATSTIIEIDTTDDLSYEMDETFTVKLVSAMNASIADDPDSTATGTINNDDFKPELSIAPATNSEGSDLAFAVIVSPVSGIDAQVSYSAAGVTATPVDDYIAPLDDAELIIPAGDAMGTISILTIMDLLDEPLETLTVTLSHPVNATLGSPFTATGTILDVIPPGVTLNPTSLRVLENSTETYTVVLDAEPTGPVTITQSADSDDLTVTPSSRTFTTSNWATPQTFTVTAADDGDFGNKEATIAHAVSGGGYDSVEERLVVTIVDDDLTLTIVPVPGFETVTEGEPALFHIIASNPTPGTVVSRAYSYRGDFPREWKSRSRGLVTIVDVDGPWLMTVDTVDDDAYERDGSVTMRLVVDADSAYAVGNPSSATVQVLDNDTGQVPGTVAAPRLEWASRGTLAVLWSEPSDLGNPPTGTRYDVRYRVTGVTAWSNGPQNLTRAQTTIFLGGAQSWQVQVRASNLAGDGPWSASATIRSGDQSDPGGAGEPPRNLQGEAVAHQRLPIWSIEVDWDYPKDLSWWQLKGWMLQWQHECVPDPDPENWSSTAKAATPLEGGVQWLGPGKSVQIRVAPIYIHGGGGGVSEGIGPFSEPVCVTTPDEWTPPDLGERPPLTVSFEEVPERHGGSVRFFTLEITFSERMDVTGGQLVKALQITGGHARDVPPIRVEPPWTLDTTKPDAWKVYVTPSSDQPVTVTIPAGGNCGDGALCTEDGRALSESISVTIPGP